MQIRIISQRLLFTIVTRMEWLIFRDIARYSNVFDISRNNCSS